MKAEQFSDILGQIDTDLLPKENEITTGNGKAPVGRKPWVRFVAAAACAAVALGIGGGIWWDHRAPVVTDPAASQVNAGTDDPTDSTPTDPDPVSPTKPTKSPGGNGRAVLQLTMARYPALAPYPNDINGAGLDMDAFDAWDKDLRAQRKKADGLTAGMDGFYRQIMQKLLAADPDEPGKNRVCSPLNIYLALGTLAECTGGNTRSELFRLLGVDSIDALRRRNDGLWNANYRDDGAVTSLLANGLFLSGSEKVSDTTLATLGERYYTDVFRGVAGSPEYDETLRGWINNKTGDLLKDAANGLSIKPDALATLVSTVQFRAKWVDTFAPENNRQIAFHTAGGDRTVTALYRESMMFYTEQEKFTAVHLGLDDGTYGMWLMLPKKGYTPADLVTGNDMVSLLTSPVGKNGQQHRTIKLTLPKFDISADRDIAADLRSLGVSEIFDPDKSDLSALFPELAPGAVTLDSVDHAARVAIDEEGVTAAAYTVMQLCGGAMSTLEPIEMTFDRPFAFAVTGVGNTVLFAGAVEDPT